MVERRSTMKVKYFFAGKLHSIEVPKDRVASYAQGVVFWGY